MQKAPVPNDEKDRLEALHKIAILDTKPEQRFDFITEEAVKRLKVPISTISILDKDREWFKSCVGLKEKEGDRSTSFCGHALLADNIFVVSDTQKDKRFFDNPKVIGAPFIRFYAGVALREYKTQQPIGVLCVKDIKPRVFTVEETAALIELAEKAEKELNK